MNVMCKQTAGSTTRISRFLKTNNRQKKGENVFCDRKHDLEHRTSVTQAKTTAITDLVRRKEQLFVHSCKGRNVGEALTALLSTAGRGSRAFFPRNMSLRTILKGDRI